MEKDSPTMSLESLEKLYTEGKFGECIDIMLANKPSFPEGLFHYNLGTLYAKNDALAAGRYHLEKSISRDFLNSMSVNNLETVKVKLNVNDLSSSENIHDRILDSSLIIPGSIYLSISMILTLVFMAIIKWKKIKSMTVRGMLILMAFIPFGYHQMYLSKVTHAVVLKDAQIYDGPSKIYFNSGVVRAGSKIITSKHNNGWHLIQSPITLSGWIHRDSLGFY